MNKEETNKVEPIDLTFKYSAYLLKKMFKMLNTVNDTAVFSFNKENIFTLMVDPAHILMIKHIIPRKSILEYALNNEVKLGLDLKRLNYIFKNINKNDMFRFTYSEKKDIYKSFIKLGLFDYELELIDKNISKVKEPTLDFPSKFIVNIKILHDFIVQANEISDCFKITCDKEYIELYAEGDSDKITIKINKDVLQLLHSDGKYTSLFSTDIFLSIIKELKTLYNGVEIRLGNDKPIKLLCDRGYKTMVLLAPRIASE